MCRYVVQSLLHAVTRSIGRISENRTESIGVGQYQHDVNQTQLARKLDAVVEDCVNAVGVDLNTASAPLLARVAGMTKTLAQNIVEYRDENGRFESRSELKKVPRLGPKSL